MKNPLFISFICAAMWGIWPTLAKISKMSPSVISVSLAVFTALSVILWLTFKKEMAFTEVTSRGMILVIICGMLNATGMILYGKLLSSHSGFDVSKYVGICTGLLPVFSLIVSWLILHENMTLQKIGGVALIFLGVYFLSTSK